MEFKEFFLAVLDSWVEKVGIFLTVLAFVEKIPKVREYLHERPVIDRFVPVLWGIGIFCIIWGFYSAWLIQYRDAQAKQKKIDELTKPDFEISNGTTVVSHMVVTNQDKTTNEFASVFIPIVVFNHGAPSVIKGSALTAKFPDGKEIQGIPFLPPGEYLQFRDMNGNMLSIPTAGSLLQRGTAVPIPTGGQADGFVLYRFPREYKEILATLDTVLTLDIEDVAHKHYLGVMPMGTPATNFYSTPSLVKH
jgi:hypothetical protein